jgi:hypothetical protein
VASAGQRQRHRPERRIAVHSTHRNRRASRKVRSSDRRRLTRSFAHRGAAFFDRSCDLTKQLFIANNGLHACRDVASCGCGVAHHARVAQNATARIRLGSGTSEPSTNDGGAPKRSALLTYLPIAHVSMSRPG